MCRYTVSKRCVVKPSIANGDVLRPDANEKLQKEKEKHALTSQSLQHMTVKLRSLKAKITLSDYHTQSRFHSLDQELQVLENTSQEMKSKNIQHVTELEKQLSSRDKQISGTSRIHQCLKNYGLTFSFYRSGT